MATETVLHSGCFNDYDGNIIEVTFYSKTDLNASPSSLHFKANGETLQLTIWSRDGDAYLGDNFPEWLTYSQVSSEPLVGSPFYRYTYNITADENPGTKRDYTITVCIEGIGFINIEVPVTQAGQN